MNWPTIVTIILGSSFLGAILNNLINWLLKSRSQTRYNSFIALTLVHRFENYTHDCVSSIADHDVYHDSRGAAGELISLPPEAFTLPDENFRDFDLKLLDEVLDFPQRVAFATEEVHFVASIVDHDDARVAAYKNSLLLAELSLTLADRLRARYKISVRKLKFGEYDIRQVLKEKANA